MKQRVVEEFDHDSDVDLAPLSLDPRPEATSCLVSVVFPCLNEAESVGACVKDALSRLQALGAPSEVVVADNGSDDGSVQLAASAGARVVHAPRRGYGAALIAAIEAAQGRYIIMADSDASYDLSALERMIEELQAGADLVIGNRFHGQIRPGAMPFLHRYVGNPLLSGLLNLFFAINVGDAHCGMRGFTREAYQKMALRTTGMEFASEMVARAARLQLRIAEVPVDYHPRLGRSKLRRYRDGWRHLRFLLMYSPSWFYLLPSLIAAATGLGLLLLLSLFELRQIDFVWRLFAAVLGSLLTVLASQTVWLGLSARTVAVAHGFDPGDRFVPNMYRYFTLERGLLIAGSIVLGGALVTLWIVLYWMSSASAEAAPVAPLILAATLITVGLQAAFNSFFLSLLGVETRVVDR